MNLFEFDYDLTLMMFFLDADEQVYARYGGRDSKSADSRHSLAGLRYTMNSVLEMHARGRKEFAPKTYERPKSLRDLAGTFRQRDCMHCHQVKEAIDENFKRSGKWARDMFWRYPPPENLGFALEVDRGNVVEKVTDQSPAASAGLKAGDIVTRLNGVPIHSFGDAQFALDRAPTTGTIAISYLRRSQSIDGNLALNEDWRKTDVYWRSSANRFIPYARVYGPDLTAEEKKALGLAPKQLAFRQKNLVTQQAKAAGVLGGDIIYGADDKLLEMNAAGFIHYIQRNYFIGDTVTLNIIRDGKRMSLKMLLIRQ